MSGVGFLDTKNKPFSVVIDDFIHTGDTVKTILKDIDSNITTRTLCMLCVDNYLSDKKIAENPIIYEFLQRFNCVLCNKAREKGNNEPIIIDGYDVS